MQSSNSPASRLFFASQPHEHRNTPRIGKLSIVNCQLSITINDAAAGLMGGKHEHFGYLHMRRSLRHI